MMCYEIRTSGERARKEGETERKDEAQRKIERREKGGREIGKSFYNSTTFSTNYDGAQ